MFLNFLKSLFGGSGSNVQLEEKIGNSPFLVDVRSPNEFKSGSVPGAVNIPLDQLEQKLGQFKDKSNVIVFCFSGARSGKAASILLTNGITDVMNGGSWTAVKNALDKSKSSW